MNISLKRNTRVLRLISIFYTFHVGTSLEQVLVSLKVQVEGVSVQKNVELISLNMIIHPQSDCIAD